MKKAFTQVRHAEANAEASPKLCDKAMKRRCFAALNMTAAFTLAGADASKTIYRHEQSCHAEFISASKIQTLKHLTASPTDAGSHTSPLALWFPLRSQGDMRKKSAFTLAETLTTLIVIGIIAVLILPVLKGDVDIKVLDSQKKTFNTKLKQGLNNMQIHSALAEEYATTADFITAMKKYMGISKSCTSTKLSDCFASKIKESKSSTKYETKNIKTSADIEASWAKVSDLGAVVFSDGTSAIIAHNPNCVITNKFDVSADTTQCFAMIYDINGPQAPNIIGEDMDTINLNYGENEIEIGEIFYPTSYTKAQCLKAIDDGAPIKQCNYEDDYWASAVDTCYKKGLSLPTRSQLKDIAMEVYGENVSLSGNTTGLSVQNQEIWAKLGSPNSGVYFWASEEYSATHSSLRYFTSSSSNGNNSFGRHISSIRAFCLGDE